MMPEVPIDSLFPKDDPEFDQVYKDELVNDCLDFGFSGWDEEEEAEIVLGELRILVELGRDYRELCKKYAMKPAAGSLKALIEYDKTEIECYHKNNEEFRQEIKGLKEIILAAMPALRMVYKSPDNEGYPYEGTAERFIRQPQDYDAGVIHSYYVYEAAKKAVGLK